MDENLTERCSPIVEDIILQSKKFDFEKLIDYVKKDKSKISALIEYAINNYQKK